MYNSSGLGDLSGSGESRSGLRSAAHGATARAQRATLRTERLAETAAADPLALDDAEWEQLLRADGADLDALARVAGDVRR